MLQLITNTEPWLLAVMGGLFSVLIAILLTAFWDLATGLNKDPRRQEIYFGHYEEIVLSSTEIAPLIGLFSTNSLGGAALFRAAPILSGGGNVEGELGQTFTIISLAMNATSVGILIAICGSIIKIPCRWIYSVEPLENLVAVPGKKIEDFGKRNIVISADRTPDVGSAAGVECKKTGGNGSGKDDVTKDAEIMGIY